jgi:hypothetical protein
VCRRAVTGRRRRGVDPARPASADRGAPPRNGPLAAALTQADLFDAIRNHRTFAAKDSTLSANLPTIPGSYYYARLVHSAGTVAWTAPIWVE